MKKVTLLLLTGITFFAFACKNQEKTTENNTKKMNQSQNTYALVVSFISIGQGVDQKAIEQFNQLIADIEQKKQVKINYEKIPWGREGEVDYCFNLSELDKETRQLFLTKTDELLSKNTLVKVEKNAACVHKR